MLQPANYPFPIRVFNKCGFSTKLDAQKLIDSAVKKTGLNDYGDSELFHRLQLLCDSINAEANLHPFGALICKERLKAILVNRLLAVQYLRDYPMVLQEKIKAPIIITGLQRTGTTYLQRILSVDPQHRALLSWEALNPIPSAVKNDREKRIKKARFSQQFLKYIAPDFFKIHPVEFDSPEEEILLNDMCLLSAIPEATMQVPSFANWVENQDHVVAYAWMKNMLKILQFQQENKRWILKTPQHLEYMDAVADQFPDSIIIHTHRNPLECVPSFFSMVYHSRRVFSDKVDPMLCADHWLRKNVYMLHKMMDFRDRHPNFSVFDIYYDQLVKDPIAVLRQIYEQLDCEIDPVLEKTFLNSMKQHKKNKYGVHRYSIKDFGLDESKLKAAFEFYTDRYFRHE